MKKITLLAFALSALPTFAQPGYKDTTFGNNGHIITSGSAGAGRMSTFILMDNGKILAAGSSNPAQSNNNGMIIQYTSSGQLDTSFGSGGIGYYGGSTSDRTFHDLALQSDGKIIAVGRGNNVVYPYSPGLTVTRILPSGSPDYSFGTNSASFFANAWFSGNAIVMLPDDKFLMGVATNNAQDFLIVRRNADGTYDPTFANNGGIVVDFDGHYDTVRELRLTADGKIMAMGDSSFNSSIYTALSRFNSDGSPDTTFGTNGKLLVPFSSATLTLDATGSFFLTRTTGVSPNLQAAIYKYTDAGTLDASFGTDGIATHNFGFETVPGDLAVDKNGNIIVGFTTPNSDTIDYIVAKFSADGVLDTAFGPFNGYNTFHLPSFSGYGDGVHTLKIQEDNKIVVGSLSYGFTLARFNSDPVVLGTGEHLPQKPAVLSPNPTSGQFSVQSDAALKSLSVYDATGKWATDKPDLSDQPQGIYYVKVVTDDGTSVIKVLKQ